MGNTIGDYGGRGSLNEKMQRALDSLASAGWGNLSINSGFRSAARNRAAGGARRSQHIHGNAVDINVSSLSPAQKASFLDAAANAGMKGIGVYQSGNVIHIDARRNPTFWGPSKKGKYKSAPIGAFPSWAQATLNRIATGVGRPKVDVANAFPPAPSALPKGPALAYLPSKEPVAPTPPASLTQAAPPSLALAPSNNSVPALGAIEAIAPSRPSQSLVGQPLAPDMSRFAPEVSAPVAPALDTNFGGINPESQPGFNGTWPGLAMPATPSGPTGAETLFAKAQAPAPQGVATPQTAAQTQVTPGLGLMNLAERPKALPSALTQPSPLANTMPSFAAPNFNAMLPGNMQSPTPMGLTAPGVGPLPQAPVLPQQMQPPPPMAPPPDQIQTASFPDAPPAPPSLSVGDIYGGAIGSAMSGGNTISRDANGITSVTNRFGVTTGMTPDGKQTAYGATGPNLGNLFGGLKGMDKKTTGMLAGAALGALAGGLPGAVAGGLIGRTMTPGRNSFPTAPGRHGERNGVPGGDRTHAERSSRSPAAADHMGRNTGMTGLW